jgi:hypothetical protein
MQKYRPAHHQGHAPVTRDSAPSRPWLISPAWRYALTTFDLLEEERRRSLERMEKSNEVEEGSVLR